MASGALGDCWFLGALAGTSSRLAGKFSLSNPVVATRKDLIRQLLVTAKPEVGLYQLYFWSPRLLLSALNRYLGV
jgi:hypothetical protein